MVFELQDEVRQHARVGKVQHVLYNIVSVWILHKRQAIDRNFGDELQLSVAGGVSTVGDKEV